MNPLKQLIQAFTGAASSPASHVQVPLELLSPIAPGLPCGPSLDYDPEYAVLQSRLAPKADVQYGSFSAQSAPPDWPEIERDCRRLLLRSKDIPALVWLTRARTRMAGANGLLEGLQALLAVLQAFPKDVHPQLMLDDTHDPAVRANALAALCDPEGLMADVRDVVVSGNTALRLTVRDVERAFAVPRPPYALEPEAVNRQLADLNQRGDTVLSALLGCGTCVQAIDRWGHDTLGDDAPHFAPLLKLLGALTSFSKVNTAAPKMQAEMQGEGGDALDLPNTRRVAPASPILTLTPQTDRGVDAISPTANLPMLSAAEQREHIRGLLVQVRQWIEHHEPSSPVSVLLKQAERMWGKRFSEVAGMIPPDLLQTWDQD
ncbi:hypothetical protein os1_21620 [Comamonadaceae bacterium OS-1]|nr:hypothetical protein os1_21620 [Comamonadaceae bacterium OS-1]